MSVQKLLQYRFGQDAKKLDTDISKLATSLNHKKAEDKVYYHDDKINMGIKNGQQYLLINKQNSSNNKPKKQSKSNGDYENGHNVIYVEKIIEVPTEVQKIVQVPVQRIIQVIRQIEVPVEKIVEVQKIIQIQKIKEIPVQVMIEKPIYIEKIVEKIVQVPTLPIKEEVIVEKPIYIDRQVIVQKPIYVEKPIYIDKYIQVQRQDKNEQEKIIEKIIEIPVIKQIVVEKQIPIEKIVQVEKIVQKPIEKIVVVQKIIEVQKVIEVEKIVEIEKIVQVPVDRIVEIEKIVYLPVQKIIEVPVEMVVQKEITVEVPIQTIIQKPVQKIIEKIVQKPIFIEKNIFIEKIVEVPITNEQPIVKYITIEKIVQVPVEVIIQKPVEKIVEVEKIKEIIIEKIIQIPVQIIIEKPVQKIVEIQKTIYLARDRQSSRDRQQLKLQIDSENILSQRNQYGTAKKSKRKTFSQKDMPQDDISFKSSSRGYSSRQIDCSAHKMLDKVDKKSIENYEELQDQILNLKQQLRLAHEKIQEYEYESVKQNGQEMQERIKQIEQLQQQEILLNEKLEDVLVNQMHVEKQNKNLKSNICDLQALNADLNIKLRQKQQIVQKLIKENQFLLKQVETFKQLNEETKAENEERTIKLIQELNRQRQENNQMVNRYTLLTQSLNNSKEQIQELKNINQNLEEYNRGLSSIIEEKAQIEEQLLQELHNLKNQRHEAQTTINEEASQQILRLNEENQELTQSLKQAYEQIRELQQHSFLLQSKQQQFQSIIEKVNKLQKQIEVEQQEYANIKQQQKQKNKNKILMGSKSAGFLAVDQQLLNQEAEEQIQSNFRNGRKNTDGEIQLNESFDRKREDKLESRSGNASKNANNLQSNKMIEQLLSELQKEKLQQKQLHNMIQKVKTQLVHSQRQVYKRNQTIDNLNILLSKKQHENNGDNKLVEQFTVLKTEYAKLQRQNKDLRESVDRLHQNITDIHDGKHLLSIDSNIRRQVQQQTIQISLEAFVQQYLENDRITQNLVIKIFDMFVQQIVNGNYKSYQPRNLLVMTNNIDPSHICIKVVAGSHKAFGQTSKIQFIAPQLLQSNDKNKSIVFTQASAIWNAALLIDFILCKQPYFKNMQQIRQFKDKYIMKNKKYSNIKPTLQIMLCKNPKQRTQFNRITDTFKEKLLER